MCPYIVRSTTRHFLVKLMKTRLEYYQKNSAIRNQPSGFSDTDTASATVVVVCYCLLTARVLVQKEKKIGKKRSLPAAPESQRRLELRTIIIWF